MRNSKWEQVKANVSLFAKRNKKALRRTYWTLAALFLVGFGGMLAYVQFMGYFDPISTPAMMRMTPDEMREMREMEQVLWEYWREQSRQGDFAEMMWLLHENYPFFEMGLRNGVDIVGIGIDAFAELEGVAAHLSGTGGFQEFINSYFMNHIGGLGGLRIAAAASRTALWLSEPYYMGHSDFRFYDDRFDAQTSEQNHRMSMVTDDVAYLQIEAFLSKGYTPINNHPYWRYDFNEERQELLRAFRNVNNAEHLIIDIRGINEGFSEYFLPLLIEPNIYAPIMQNFYAFHTGGNMAMEVSASFREFHSLGRTYNTNSLLADMPMANVADFENLIHGFEIALEANPTQNSPAFGGKIWLLTDSANFSGINQMYLAMAEEAGFEILYVEDNNAPQWPVPFARLPQSGLSVRHNVFYFTNNDGIAFEEQRIAGHYNLQADVDDALSVAFMHITGAEMPHFEIAQEPNAEIDDIISITNGIAFGDLSITFSNEVSVITNELGNTLVIFDDVDGNSTLIHQLTASAPMQNFSWIAVGMNESGELYEAEVLYAHDGEVSVFIVNWIEWGTVPHRGVSFVDENGNVRRFFIAMNNAYPDEGDGIFLLREF
ncbi:MAG: hypothetical protein FWE33_00360 [Defluviitaleaceae bacterium]|nr:hypothetical protein [Defluviitaleaceae bacterium]